MVFGLAGHDFVDPGVEQIVAHVAAEIAVRDDADEIAVAVGDADAAKALGRHLQHRIRHLGAERGERDRLAAVHDVAGEFQQRAEPAAGMQQAEIDRGEAAAFQERDRQRVAERQLHERGGGRREIVRAGLASLRQHQRHIGGLAERAVAVRGHGHQADPEAPRIVDQVLELGGFARPRQRHDDVVGRDHAEIAMARFAGMHEKRRRSGGGQGRRDLAGDVAGLAHAGDDDAALGARGSARPRR